MCSYTPAESGMPLKGAMHAIFFFNALSEVLPALPNRCTHRATGQRFGLLDHYERRGQEKQEDRDQRVEKNAPDV